jgi:Tfp pilus assembly protein PilO
MNRKKKPKTLLITCIAAAGALAYMFLVFIPGQKAIASVRAELRRKQDAITEADTLVLGMQQTQSLHEKVHTYKKNWTDSTPPVDRVATVFAAVSSYAKQSGVSVVRFEPQSPARMSALSQVPVTLVVDGEYSQIFDLLKRLDASPYPLWEKDLVIQGGRETPKILRCQVSLTIFADNRDKSN